MDIHEEIKKQAIRLEKIENHFDYFKESNFRVESKMEKLFELLTGNEFNENGLSKKIFLLEEKNKKIIESIEKNKNFTIRLAMLGVLLLVSVVILYVKNFW